MSVYAGMIWLAVRWTEAREHFDLVWLPGTPE